MRILGLDYGEKRIGVAVCDELGLTAQGLMTISRKNRRHDMGAIGNVVRTYGVEKIVMGYPLMLNGEEGIQCEKVKHFADILKSAFSIPVVMQDETLTTKEAEEVLISAGIKREKRKLMVDRLAACMILQAYLDQCRRPIASEAKHGRGD